MNNEKNSVPPYFRYWGKTGEDGGKKGFLPQAENGLVQLPLAADDTGWRGVFGGVTVRYSKEYGLEREDSNDKQ